ncbi:response regulator [uncultured Paludibaculum sp.]|uniref:response regulator n=1 Tax=uncultured Paludibaculum sp. TaxID=1765020 RepID=UPI002AAB2156|nr:response regulator [uncultured Paludibaculum sp.]
MRILSVDDNAENRYLVEVMAKAHAHEVVSARNGLEALDHLAKGPFDLIVSDVLMPAMDGFQLCRQVKADERLKRIPFVFYTATYTARQDEELGLALGASRFIMKPMEPDEFLAVVEQVMREGEAGTIVLPAVDLDDNGKSLSVYNERLVRKLEHKIQQLEAARNELAASVAEKDDEIARRRLTEEALARSEEQLRLMWDGSTDGMRLTDRNGIILRANPALARMFAKPLDSLSGQPFTCCYRLDDPEAVLARYRERVDSRNVEEVIETMLLRWDGEQLWVEGSNATIELASGPVVFSVLRDVTQRERSAQERAELELQFRQAQKLESIGRLAGGVAHDFNNLLTVINGYSGLLLGQLHASDPLREKIEEIHKAGERAAGLTRQLLAFSRKQVLQPRVLDLNRIIQATQPMLARLVGEDVGLGVQLHREPATIYADPSHLEQVLMNLAVNSRDAMPRGGKLRIETSVVELPGESAPADHGAHAGRYVVLTMSDDGEGMSEETRLRIFEPFFTTKEVGKGTGLGLSMVQGIVVQSGGFIQVHSEPGQGTSFRIYLPGVEGTLADSDEPGAVTGLRGKGTVLVVEDQVEVGKYVAAALRAYGYHAIQAVGAEEALLLCDRERGRLDLILTDVVMPNCSGKELADRLAERWPGLKVLFTSGYADDAMARHGLPPQGSNFIQKPFSPEQLALKVREILLVRDREDGGSSGLGSSNLPG